MENFQVQTKNLYTSMYMGHLKVWKKSHTFVWDICDYFLQYPDIQIDTRRMLMSYSWQHIRKQIICMHYYMQIFLRTLLFKNVLHFFWYTLIFEQRAKLKILCLSLFFCNFYLSFQFVGWRAAEFRDVWYSASENRHRHVEEEI